MKHKIAWDLKTKLVRIDLFYYSYVTSLFQSSVHILKHSAHVLINFLLFIVKSSFFRKNYKQRVIKYIIILLPPILQSSTN